MIPMEYGTLSMLEDRCRAVGGSLLYFTCSIEQGRFEVQATVLFERGPAKGIGIGAKYDIALKEAVDCALWRRVNVVTVEKPNE